MKNYTVDREKICVYDGYNIEQCSKCQSINSCKYLRSQLPLFEFLKIDDVTEVFDTKGIPQISISKKKSIYREKVVDHSWDYLGANTKEYTHRLHNYPAMMIPQVAGRLIETYRKKDSVLLDPFCGSGTVLVEAKLFGLNSYGIDINPLARLLSEVKTTLIEPYLLVRIKDKMLNNLKNIPDVIEYKTPNFHNIDFWFKKSVIKKLAIIKNEIYKIRDEEIKKFFLIVFSEVVRDVSNTRNNEFKLYRMPEEKLFDFNPDVFKIFVSKLERNILGMKMFYEKIDKRKNVQAIILDEDTRDKTSLKNESIGLVVTSPPYGDSKTTVSYGQFSRLSLQWMGLEGEDLAIDINSLGGKELKLPLSYYTFSSILLQKILYSIGEKDKWRARDVFRYFLDLRQCFIEISRVMHKGAIACIVIGNRSVKGIRIPSDEIICDFGDEFNLRHQKTIIRSIPNKRMPSRNSPTNIIGKTEETMLNEYIVILQKEE